MTAPRESGRRGGAGAIAIGAAACLLALALNPGAVDNVDSRLVLRTAESLLDRGAFGLADVAGTPLGSIEYGSYDPAGAFQMKFGPGNAILAAPFVAAGRAVLPPLGLDLARAGEAGYAAASCLWFGAAAALLWALARRVAGVGAAWWAVVAHCVAGYGLVYGRSSYLETPLTVAVLLAWIAAWDCRTGGSGWRAPLILGAACGAALWIKTASVLFLAGVPVLLLGPGGLRASLRASVTFVPLAGLLLWCNAERFGSPFETGYAGSLRFDRPVAEGSAALLFSERGLLFYAPLALLGFAGLASGRAETRSFRAAVAVAALAVVPVHAAFFSPYGGDAWGPRYLVPLAALLAVSAGALLLTAVRAGGAPRLAAGAALGFGAMLQAAPSIVSFRDHWSLRPLGADAAPPGPTLARIASHRVRGVAPTAESLGLPGGAAAGSPRLPSTLDLWPARFASVPGAPRSLGAACWGVSAAAATAGVFLLLRAGRRS